MTCRRPRPSLTSIGGGARATRCCTAIRLPCSGSSRTSPWTRCCGPGSARTGEIPKRVNLYVGTPYCLPTDPDRCGFCLFPTEIYTGQRQLEEYLEHLEREGDLFRDHFAGAELASIYFGGGTSNLYRPHQYSRLMEIVGGVFDIPGDIEITLEGIPQTFSHDKLLAMKQSGMNRISMGVQQLDEELIKASGRRQRSDQVFRTLESCEQLDLPISVDLIFGWPNQTLKQMVRDPGGDRGDRGRAHHPLRAQPRRAHRLRPEPPGRAALDRRQPRDVPHRQVGARSLRLHPGHPLRLRAPGRGGAERVPVRRAVPQAVRVERDRVRSDSTPGAGATPASRSSSVPPSRRGGRS